jgi:hypothetical protein
MVLAPNGQPAALEALRNQWYEGSRSTSKRSFIWFPVQDANRDLDRFTRYELSKHARYLYKNSPLLRGVIERLVTLTIGSGFHPVFKSSNPAWNKRAKQLWRKKSRNVHLGARASMTQYQRCVARARFVDGEGFTIKTSEDAITFEDRVQGVEADRVTGVLKPTTSGYQIDGFNLNSQGTVVGYNIRGVTQEYPAEHVIQHFTPTRLGQYRGETILASAINTARDVDDILALEKECVKDASSKKDVIKTASGTLDAESFRSLRYGMTGEAPLVFNLPVEPNTKDDYYRTQFGAQPVVLKKGDEYTPYKPDRPGSAWQGFMEFLSMTICLSTTLPPTVFIPISTGGTDIRRDLDIAQRVVDPWQMDIACEMDEIVDYLLQSEVNDGELKKDLPEDWMNRAWHFPQKINVDRNQAQQDRDDVARGLMSREEFHGRYGDDAIEVDATVMDEAKRRKKDIADAGFKSVEEFLQILSLDPNAFQKQKPEGGNPPPK